jgi:FlaG/FlaF family flagellin (archaellin)
MADISVDVTIKDGQGSYSSKSSQVQPDGTITINPGENDTITFVPASGQGWTFLNPGIVVQALTPGIDDVSIVSQSSTSVVIEDDNSSSVAPSNYEYTLRTTAGNLDPAIINKGG